MKKALKIVGIALGTVVLLIAAAALYFNIKGIPYYEVNAPEVTVEPTPERVARGEYIVNQTCVICHLGKDGKLSGTLMEDDPDFGTWYAPNITQHPEAGIGKYTDGELMYLLRTGIKHDGEFALPFMPRFNLLSDEDVKSIIAYLRSDAPRVQPVGTPPPPNEPTLLAKVVANLAMKPLPYPEAAITAPPRTDEVAYGKYLVNGVMMCFSCHSASFETLDEVTPENSEGYLGGGNRIINPQDRTIAAPSANITMHPELGLGQWTKEQFANAVRFGQGADGVALSPAMPKYTLMSEEDISAIWAYLQTVPVVDKALAEAGTANE
ncbi:MAG: c-type cytochrome [Lewinellaceae bacterium]|nr:c-type cytochrome [Lewinellaceae bacterium]